MSEAPADDRAPSTWPARSAALVSHHLLKGATVMSETGSLHTKHAVGAAACCAGGAAPATTPTRAATVEPSARIVLSRGGGPMAPRLLLLAMALAAAAAECPRGQHELELDGGLASWCRVGVPHADDGVCCAASCGVCVRSAEEAAVLRPQSRRPRRMLRWRGAGQRHALLGRRSSGALRDHVLQVPP